MLNHNDLSDSKLVLLVCKLCTTDVCNMNKKCGSTGLTDMSNIVLTYTEEADLLCMTIQLHVFIYKFNYLVYAVRSAFVIGFCFFFISDLL